MGGEITMWGCYKMDGNEWTLKAKCYCTAKTVNEAIEKSNKLEKQGILTIIREIGECIK